MRKVGDAEIVREIYHEVYLAGLVNLHQLREVTMVEYIIKMTRLYFLQLRMLT